MLPPDGRPSARGSYLRRGEGWGGKSLHRSEGRPEGEEEAFLSGFPGITVVVGVSRQPVGVGNSLPGPVGKVLKLRNEDGSEHECLLLQRFGESVGRGDENVLCSLILPHACNNVSSGECWNRPDI